MLSALPFYYLFIIISATAFASTTRKMKAEFQDFTDQMLPCKGRRSKRPRASPPVGVAIDSSPSEDGDGTKHPCVSRPVGVAVNSSPSGDGGGGCDGCYSSLVHSPTSSCSQMSMAIQEDENMAHCLILLARSGCPKQDAGNDVTVERISCRKSSHTAAAATANPAATTTTTTSVYECKTCNRKFPSFQALGGHRASHSKPKLIPEDHKKSTPFDHHHHYHDQDNTHEKSNKTKIHECSICGSLFYSGQALGGHMRRHRPLHMNTTTTIMKASMDNDDDQEKPKPVFTLDLNLPAPDDDEADEENTAMFEFSDKQQSSAFSTSAMVDCHY